MASLTGLSVKGVGGTEGRQVGRVRLHESMGWSLGFILSGKGYEMIYLCIRKVILITV